MEQPRHLRRRRRASRPAAGPADTTATTTPAPEAEAAPSGSAAPVGPGAEVTVVGSAGEVVPVAESAVAQVVDPAEVAGSNRPAVGPDDGPLADLADRGAIHPIHGSPGSAAATGPHPSAEHGRPPGSATGEGARRTYRAPREDQSERSLRALVTTRSTQVSPTAALRAREVAMPSADDLAVAEAELVVVRRHYVPPTALAAGLRRDRPERRPAGGNQPAGQPNRPSPPGQPAPSGPDVL